MASQKAATLSVCMIVKNEAQYLGDCLNSVRPVADQIVVVDTGSTDDTVEIARAHGAEIHHFSWCDDFSAARNASIAPASGEWILWLDADERLRAADIPLLRSLLVDESLPVAYLVDIYNITRHGNNALLSNAHRLFNNHRGICFSGRIHEQISPSVAAAGGEERRSGMVLDHLGYAADGERQEQRSERNERLLKKMVKEQPQNAYAHYTLAQFYALAGEHHRALPHFETAYRKKQFDAAMTASLLNSMSDTLIHLDQVDRAARYARESLRLFPRQVGGCYVKYRVAAAHGDSAEAIRWLKQLLENSQYFQQHPKQISTDVLIEAHKIHYELGRQYLKCGNTAAALAAFEAAGETAPGEPAIHEQLAAIHLSTNELQKAEGHLHELVSLSPKNEQYIDLLSKVLIRQERFPDAIGAIERYLESSPGDLSSMRRLAGLYAKVGQLAAAEALMRHVSSVQN